jgi:AcrR family transcriptional regulator
MSKTTDVSITRRQLYRLVWSRPLSQVAEEWGLSANGLSRICDRMQVPYPPKGYWARVRAGRKLPRPTLPRDPENDAQLISISSERSPSRRSRTRLSAEERRSQLMEAAKAMIVRDGLHLTTMKRIAREVGLSEAQAHNYFTRDELLVELARKELAEMEENRRAEIDRGQDTMSRRVLGTIRYLQEVERRGALIQVLLMSPSVRQALRPERRTKSSATVARIIEIDEREHGVPPYITRSATRMLTAVALRAGRLLANRKITLEMAERLTVPIMIEGRNQVNKVWGQPKAAAK